MYEWTNVSLNLIVRYLNERVDTAGNLIRNKTENNLYMAIDFSRPSFIIIVLSHKTQDENAYNTARDDRTNKAKLCLHAAPTQFCVLDFFIMVVLLIFLRFPNKHYSLFLLY